MIEILRHMEVFNPDNFTDNVHIIGCGSIGSNIALSMAKLGIPGDQITAYDFDKVEEHNIANQAYALKHIGWSKVDALFDQIKYYTGEEIDIREERVEDKVRLNGIVFLVTDTMKSRREIFNSCIKMKMAVKLMIEVRMDAAEGRVYTINPMSYSETKFWEDVSQYTDEQAVTSACGHTTTVGSTVGVLSNLAVWQFINWFNKKPLKNELFIGLENMALN